MAPKFWLRNVRRGVIVDGAAGVRDGLPFPLLHSLLALD